MLESGFKANTSREIITKMKLSMETNTLITDYSFTYNVFPKRVGTYF